MGARKTVLGYEDIADHQIDSRMIRYAVEAVGCDYAIRSSRYSQDGKPKRYVGKIHSVRPTRYRVRGQSKVVQFTVWMACGQNEVIREFVMEKLPH